MGHPHRTSAPHEKSLITAGRRLPVAAVLLAAALACGCASQHSQQAGAAQTQGSDDPACIDLRAQIDRNEKAKIAAPTLTQTPIIQQAAEAKADYQIGILRQRYDELDCGEPGSPSKPASAGTAAAPANAAQQPAPSQGPATPPTPAVP